jgi:hypothetical protein
MTTRPPKKSETLEVRLPHPTKQAFVEACREDGTTASEVVRRSIDAYLHRRKRPSSTPETGKLLAMIPRPIRKKRYVAGAATALALAAATALPSAAKPDLRSAFDRLDANRDGAVTLEEFAGPQGDIVVVRKTERAVEPPARLTDDKISEEAYAFWLADPDKPAAGGDVLVERREIRITRDGERVTEDFAGPPLDMQKTEFAKFDANKDGRVEFAEFQQRQQALLEAGFRKLDADTSGSLTPAEFRGIAPPMVESVSGPDGEQLTENLRPAIDEAALDARFAKLDANGDKLLSLEEYLP